MVEYESVLMDNFRRKIVYRDRQRVVGYAGFVRYSDFEIDS